MVISGVWVSRLLLWFDEGVMILVLVSWILLELWSLLGYIDVVYGLYYLLMYGWFVIFLFIELWLWFFSCLVIGVVVVGVVVFVK